MGSFVTKLNMRHIGENETNAVNMKWNYMPLLEANFFNKKIIKPMKKI